MSSAVISVCILTAVVILFLVFLASCYKKVNHDGEAIVINGFRKSKATFTGGFSFPRINSWARVNITQRQISVSRIGGKKNGDEDNDGLHCKDNIKADLNVHFYIGINHSIEDVEEVVKTFTPVGASDINALETYFKPKFADALKTVCKQFDFIELFEARETFREAVKTAIGKEMAGFKIYDVAIESIDQTSLDAHDERNVLDSEGIRKINEITSVRSIATNQIQKDEASKIKETDVNAREKILQLEKIQAESEARNKRECDIIYAQEKALTKEKTEEFLLQEKSAEIKRQESSEKLDEQKKMEVSVTILNNDKKIAIQKEDVLRATENEKVATQKLLAKENAEKELVVEEGAKKVADIQSQRVEIERKIAKETEETKNLIARETANREKEVKITAAQAEAESEQVYLITKSKAELEAADANSSRIKIESDAELDRQEKVAKGISALAESKKLDIAAIGLAEVEVEERRAQAIEKLGRAEAVKISEIGKATAGAKEAELKASEAGSESGRDYAKWLHTQNIQQNISLAEISANKDVGIENAKAVGNAIANADVKLFGGEGLESIRNSIMGSASMDARISGSEHLSKAAERYDDGDENLINDILEVLKKSEVSTGDIANLSLSNLISQNPNILGELKKVFKAN